MVEGAVDVGVAEGAEVSDTCVHLFARKSEAVAGLVVAQARNEVVAGGFVDGAEAEFAGGHGCSGERVVGGARGAARGG